MKRNPSQLALILFIVFTALLICGFGGFLFFKKVDLLQASNELRKAAEQYRTAGFYWEAKDVKPGPVPDNQNAADLLQASFDGPDWKELDFTKLTRSIDTGDFAGATSLLAPYSSSLNSAKMASRKPYLNFRRNWDEGLSLLFPEYAPVRQVVKALCARAQIEAGQGQFNLALDDLRAAKRLSALIGQDPTVVGMLVEIACDGITVRAASAVAATEFGHEEELNELDSMLSANPIHPDFPRSIKTEAYLGLAAFRNTDPLLLLKMQTDPNAQPQKINRKKLLKTGLPEDITERAFLTRYLQLYTEMAPRIVQYQDDPKKLGMAFDETAKRLGTHREASYVPVIIIFPVLAQAGVAVVKEQAVDLCLSALLKAMEIRARSGAYPRTIDEIPGKWIDPFNGKPLHLKLTADGIRIYSVGPDMVDNGGIDRRELANSEDPHYDLVQAYPPVKSHRTK
jgi:hypothetical protein